MIRTARRPSPTLDKREAWDDALAALRQIMPKLREKRGGGLRLLTESIVSPTLARQLNDLLDDLPEAHWHVYEPIHNDAAMQGAKWAFGKYVSSIYDFSKADVVLSLDADFLQCGPGNLRYAADFMARRRSANRGKRRPFGADEPVVHGGNFRKQHRSEGRPSAGPAIAGDRDAGTRHRRGVGRFTEIQERGCGSAWKMDRGRGQGSCWTSRPLPGVGRRSAASASSPLGARPQRPTGERGPYGKLSFSCGRPAGQSNGLLARVGKRHGARARRIFADSRRQSGFECAGGDEIRGETAKSSPPHSSRTLRGRNLVSMPVASSGGPLSGSMERRPDFRRNGIHRAAANRAALSRPVGP